MRVIGKYKQATGDIMSGDMDITFSIPNYHQRELLKKVKTDRSYSLEIKEIKDQRSLNQNRFMWKLLEEIAITYGEKDAMEIYCVALQRANVKSDYICALPETEKILKTQFRAVKFIKKVIVNENLLNMYQVFIGSSQFDTAEMSELIEVVISIAYEVNVPNVDYWVSVLR